MIPQFDQALALGYVDTRLGLIVVYGAFYASWSSLFFYAYFRDLPDDLLEAAAHRRRQRSGRLHVGGAPARRCPRSRWASCSTCSCNGASCSWGSIMLPGGDVTTAMTAIATFSTQFRTGGPLTAAATVDRGACPIFLLFIVAQRWLKTEIFGGSVKG